jgi:hypothetical protein
MRRRYAFEVWYIGQHDDDRKRAKKLAGRRMYYDRGKKDLSFYLLSLPPSRESFFSEVGKRSFTLAEVSPVELAKTVALWLEYKAIQAALAPPTSDTKGESSLVDDDHGWLDSEPTSPFTLHQHDPKELDAFVSKLDHPTRLVRNFIGLSPSQHAANVKAAMLRCEIAFHEARSSRVHLEGVEPKTLKEERNDPTFLERYRNIPAIVDSGASHGLTFSRHDFITYEKCHITVKAVGAENTVIGMGIVLYKMRATNGNICLVPGIAYHLPSCNLRLMSPQSYHQTYKGFSQLDGSEYTFFLAPAANGPERHEIRIPINDKTNLPMIFDVSTTGKEKSDAKPFFVNSIRMHQHFSGMFFGTWRCSYDYRDEGEEDEYEFRPLMHLSGKTKMSCLGCLSDDSNPNLSTGQKELLLWHYRLGISTKHVQHLMKEHERKDEEGNVVVIPPVIPAKSADAVKCDPSIRCATCEIARAKVQRPKVKHQAPRMKEKDKALSKEKYLPGDYVSMDTVPVGVPGRAFDGYGGPHAGKFFTHLTLFHDAGTGLIKVYLQQNETAAATLYSKQQFEDFLWREAGAVVKHYHSDQGSNFTSKAFREDCDEKKQSQSFSGTGAKFENANAERAVQTLFWCARTFLLHTALRWDQYGCADTNLWPQAVLYAEWLYNRTPKMTTCMSPMELLTHRRSDHRDLLRAKVFGCPSFVLDASLADGKKIPKFRSRSKVGQFCGFSDQHSSVVGLIRNLSTGSITPQYHCVYDEKFQAVAGLSTSEDDENLELYVQRLWKHLFETPYATDWYAENEVEDGEIVFEVPPLADEWLSEEEIRQKEDRLQAQVRRNQQRVHRYEQKFEEPARRRAENKVTIRFKDDPSLIDASVDGENSAEDVTPFEFSEGDGDDGNFDSEGAEGTVDDVDDLGRVRRNRGDWKHRFDDTEFVQVAEREFVQQTPSDGTRYVTKHNWRHALSFSPQEFADLSLQEKAVLRSDKLEKEFGHMSLTLMNERQMTESVRNNPVTWDSIRHPNQKPWMNRAQAERLSKQKAADDLRTCQLEEVAPDMEAVLDSPIAPYIKLSTNNICYSGSTTELICQDVHPLFLNAKLGISKADNPSWDEAMNGPDAAEYWKAAELEIATLEKMGSWEVVDRPPKTGPGRKPVLPSLWAFKKKRLPDGSVRKFKARFTARGDRQQEGVDFTETWAPVIQWTTVRMMLILACQLNLVTCSADVACAFLHSDIDSEVYVEMPKGFIKDGKVLKLNKSLYGLKQAPRLFWKYLTNSMESCGLKQSSIDPCLFIGPQVVALCYVDDILFFAKDEKYIDSVMLKLRDTGLMLEKESSAAGFLGVQMEALEKDSKGNATVIELTQCGLIDRIIANLGLDNGRSYNADTPALATPLVKDEDGDPCIEEFSYAAVVGQLLYLAGHTRPEIAYAVNQCARYMFNPKRSHEKALIRIGRYLKSTRTKGMILKPSGGLCNINAYPDADFAGLYGHESPSDPACVKSRTGFVICVANCPIMWKSTLQTKTALSTMEAEITALVHCMKELVGVMDLAKVFCEHYDLGQIEANMNVTIHEDNSGALVLANTIPPEFTPRSKFYHLETIWFREQINLRGIKVAKIETTEQLGDIFTKGLSKVPFEYLRYSMCGW